MAKDSPRILLVEDDPALARVYAEYMRGESLEVEISSCGKDALKALRHALYSTIVLDLHLPDVSGYDVLANVRQNCPAVPVIVITGKGSIEKAVKAIQGGALDFVLKPVSKQRLIVTVRHALEHTSNVKRIHKSVQESPPGTFLGFVGTSAAMQEVYRLIEKAAPSKATVFITGESGTGKEVTAQALHDLSPRAKNPLVALNCGAIPKDLMESEIFGHIKGAFTGAVEDRDGAATLADGGTLFLDEICEMDPALQVKLLRFIQTDTFRKIGGKDLETVDVRFVCATNRDPWEEVQAGRFREDLFYRLHVIPLHLPPLSERGEDVMALANYFLKIFVKEENKRFTGFSDDVASILRHYAWPGNVRELQNVLRHVVVLFDGALVERAMLPPMLKSFGREGSNAAGNVIPYERNEKTGGTGKGKGNAKRATHRKAASPGTVGDVGDVGGDDEGAIQPMWQLEGELIQSALDKYDGDVQRAAAALELTPSSLYRRIRDLRKA